MRKAFLILLSQSWANRVFCRAFQGSWVWCCLWKFPSSKGGSCCWAEPAREQQSLQERGGKNRMLEETRAQPLPTFPSHPPTGERTPVFQGKAIPQRRRTCPKLHGGRLWSLLWPGHLSASMDILLTPSPLYLCICLFVWVLIVYLSVAGSHTVSQTGLELAIYPRLASNSRQSSCLSLQHIGPLSILIS